MSKVLQSSLLWRAAHLSWTSMTTSASTCTQSALPGALLGGETRHAAQEICWPFIFQKDGDPLS